MPIALFVQLLVGLLFSPAIIKAVMGAANTATDAVTGAASGNQITGTVQTLVKPTDPDAQQESGPTTAQIVQEGMKKPSNWFGLAALGIAGVFVIAQLRAAGHEAGTAAADTYRATKSELAAGHRSLKNPDVTNQSRRLN